MCFSILVLLGLLYCVASVYTDCGLPDGVVEFWPLRVDAGGAIPSDSLLSFGDVVYRHSYAEFTNGSNGEIYEEYNAARTYINGPFTWVITAKFTGTPPKSSDATNDYILLAPSDYPDWSDSSNGFVLACSGVTGNLKLIVGTGGNQTTYLTFGLASNVKCPSTWTTYILTYDNGAFAVYLNSNSANSGQAVLKANQTLVSNPYVYFSIGNSPRVTNGWQGGIVDAVFYNRVLSADEIGKLQPFAYSDICNCTGQGVIDQTGYRCNKAPSADWSHQWDFYDAASPFIDNNNNGGVGSDGTAHGNITFRANPFLVANQQNDFSANFSANAWVSGTFDAEETPFASVTWTVIAWLRRDQILAGQGVLCLGAGATCVGFSSSQPEKFGVYNQASPAQGVFVPTSGYTGTYFFVAVSFIDGLKRVEVSLREVSVWGMDFWYSNTGSLDIVGGLNWQIGSQLADGGATAGAMGFDEVRFYRFALSSLEIETMGNAQLFGVASSTAWFPPVPSSSSSGAAVSSSSSAESSSSSVESTGASNTSAVTGDSGGFATTGNSGGSSTDSSGSTDQTSGTTGNPDSSSGLGDFTGEHQNAASVASYSAVTLAFIAVVVAVAL